MTNYIDVCWRCGSDNLLPICDPGELVHYNKYDRKAVWECHDCDTVNYDYPF